MHVLLPLIIGRTFVKLLNLDNVRFTEVDFLADEVGIGKLRHDGHVSGRL